MRLIRFLLLISLVIASTSCQSSGNRQQASEEAGPVTLVVHGGAGNLTRSALDSAEQLRYRKKLKKALKRGYQLLKQGDPAEEAVEQTLKVFETDSFFNAGRGSVLNENGHVRMDAALMRGSDKQAGAVASCSGLKHPIAAAHAVMDASPHVMLVSKGARQFAQQQGLKPADSAFLVTQARYRAYHQRTGRNQAKRQGAVRHQWGTVGAVALDKKGNLAAGTSTGGLSGKAKGRVGDSPTIGAGTYADNATCAVSATGQGEYFMRNLVAYDVAARMQYKDYPLSAAADSLIHSQIAGMGGKGGLIALDRQGNMALPFNTNGMFRAYKQKGSRARALIFTE
jgi:beta-aspartyl-peptidase (threonine type)